VNEPLDVPLIADSEPAGLRRAVALQRFERAGLAVAEVDAQHLAEELALVPPFGLGDAVELVGRRRRNGDGKHFRRTLLRHSHTEYNNRSDDGNACTIRRDVPFDLQPVLTGDLLELRPLRAEDFAALFAVASDPAIWEQHPVRDRYREDVFRVFFDEQLASGGALVALDTETGDVIGMSRFHGYDAGRSEVEIGWTFLARSRWGGAYNGELKRLMLRHAFRFVQKVVFLIDPANRRSQRAVEKLGAVQIESRLDGAGRESIAYQIDSATFLGGAPISG
jgi:RimJ/RimL family protein N-acetyltransferase